MAKILDGKEVGKAIRERSKEEAEKLREEGVVPQLAIMRVGEDSASISYENALVKNMEKVSIDATTITLPEETTTEELIEEIEKVNEDDSIHAMILMQPLPEHISRSAVSSKLDPRKDVDALNPANMGRLVEGDKDAMAPGTAQAVMEILDYYDYELEGADVVVIGSSPVIGKPVTIMLLNENATVANLHEFTKDNTQYSKNADILISATGALGLVDESYVKEDATVIDVGYGKKDGEVMGDVQFDAVEPHVSAITPVPGGVGSVTTSVLSSQVIKATKIVTGK